MHCKSLPITQIRTASNTIRVDKDAQFTTHAQVSELYFQKQKEREKTSIVFFPLGLPLLGAFSSSIYEINHIYFWWFIRVSQS
jgi:hypothetical protein